MTSPGVVRCWQQRVFADEPAFKLHPLNQTTTRPPSPCLSSQLPPDMPAQDFARRTFKRELEDVHCEMGVRPKRAKRDAVPPATTSEYGPDVLEISDSEDEVLQISDSEDEPSRPPVSPPTETRRRTRRPEVALLPSPKLEKDADDLEGAMSPADFTVWLDVRISDGECASAWMVEPLRDAGPKVVVSRPKNPKKLLIVFLQGRPSTLQHAKIYKVPLVRVAWVEEIRKQGHWVDFRPFQMDVGDVRTLQEVRRAEGVRDEAQISYLTR
ncbi:hypothetical protein FRC12_020224 [Ceratobasidium sp. 428]|nr:hypothetical protein FRC12_020224 [Ceratobasidium sp. 428]